MWYSNCITMNPDQLGSIPKSGRVQVEKTKRRGYLRAASTYVHDGTGTIRIHFGIVVEVGKTETTFEIVHGKSMSDSTFTPIHADVFDSLFPTIEGDFHDIDAKAWIENMRLERHNNRMIFVFDTKWLNGNFISITLKTIRTTLPFKIMLRYASEIAVAETFYPKVMGIATAQGVIEALRDIYSEYSRLCGGEYSYPAYRNEALENLEEYRQNVEEAQGKLQDICDKAANALNVLGSKYGIEVEV